MHTRGPLGNILCGELDQKPSCNAEGKLSGICWQHLRKLHQLRVKKSTITVDGKSIGKGLFAATTHDPVQDIFQNGHI